MPFDAEGYRKAAKAAGIPDDEIEKDIAEEMGNIKPVNAAPEKSDVQIGGQYDYLLPAVGAAGIGLGALGAGAVAKSIKDRWMSKPEIPRIEPSMDQSRYAGPGRIEPTLESTPITTQAPPPVHKDAPLLEAGLKNTAANAMNQQLESLQKAGAVQGSTPPTQNPAVAIAPVQTAPGTQPTIVQAVATGQNPTQAIEAEVAKQIEETPSKNKGGAPAGKKPPFYLNKAEVKKAQGEMNQYLNMFGYDAKNPESDRSKAAKQSFQLFLNESLEGKVGRGVSGNPLTYSTHYQPWLEKNMGALPEVTQVFLAEQREKALKRDASLAAQKAVAPSGGASKQMAVPPIPLGGSGASIAGGAIHRVNPYKIME